MYVYGTLYNHMRIYTSVYTTYTRIHVYMYVYVSMHLEVLGSEEYGLFHKCIFMFMCRYTCVFVYVSEYVRKLDWLALRLRWFAAAQSKRSRY